MAVSMGGNLRVGLEDSLWIGKGKFAESNAQQVRAAVDDGVLQLAAQGQVVEQPRALLYRTARNLLIDQHRRQAVRAPHTASGGADGAGGDEPMPDVAELPAPAALGPEAQAASAQGMAALLATIDALPLRCRETFILHKFAFSQTAGHLHSYTQHGFRHFYMLTLKKCLGILREVQRHQRPFVFSPAQFDTAVW